MNKIASIGIIIAGIALIGTAVVKIRGLNDTDPRKATVKITNRSKTHGGTGFIISSSKEGSQILTNAHVCGVVENGGIVQTYLGDRQVVSYLKSSVSDLCIVTVADNLRSAVNIAKESPAPYSEAFISGHPSLMPNVITRGLISGRDIISVLVGKRPCKESDVQRGGGLVCALFGGIPVVKYYESVLVGATIMPGSSGSGVYNSNNELIGVVFAGMQGLSYAWTVPYEQIIDFLTTESSMTNPVLVDQSRSADMDSEQERRLNIDNIKQQCQRPEVAQDRLASSYCDLVKKSLVQ